MILTNAKEIIVNGRPILDAYCNGAHIWPNNQIKSYRVYIQWSPEKDDNICIDGMTWNGVQLTTAMFEYSPGSTTQLDASVNVGGSWTSMTSTETDKMISGSTESLQKYCRGISFRLKPDYGFTQFTFTTDQYYAPTGTLKVEVYENGTETNTTCVDKVITQGPNTTYTFNRGDID